MNWFREWRRRRYYRKLYRQFPDLAKRNARKNLVFSQMYGAGIGPDVREWAKDFIEER